MDSRSRTGVVLAAGFGSRLKGVSSATQLKPLTPVAGRPLLVRTVDSLEKAGCSRVVIVVGYGAAEVEQAFFEAYQGDVEVIFVVNERYDLANGVSVLSARPFVSGDFILTMADHVFADEVMEIARGHCPPLGGATLLVDYKLDSIFDMDDATKVLATEEGTIQEIGKLIQTFNCVDTGVFVCTQGLMDAIQSTYDGAGDASLSDGVATLSETGRMTVKGIGAAFWQDVDTPEMLAYAEHALSNHTESTPPRAYHAQGSI